VERLADTNELMESTFLDDHNDTHGVAILEGSDDSQNVSDDGISLLKRPE